MINPNYMSTTLRPSQPDGSMELTAPFNYKDVQATEKAIASGADEARVVEFMVSKKSMDASSAKEMYSIAAKNAAAREQFGSERVDSFLQQKFPEVTTIATAEDVQAAQVQTAPISSDPQEVFNDVVSISEDIGLTSTLANYISPSKEHQAKVLRRKESIKAMMAAQGFNVNYDVDKAEWYDVDTNQQLDEENWTQLGAQLATSGGGAVIGAALGSALGPLGTLAGGVAGGIAGDLTYEVVDYFKGAFDLDADDDSKVIIANLQEAALDGAIISVAVGSLGLAAKGTLKAAKATKRGYDNLKGGKVKEALGEFNSLPNSTPAESYEKVQRILAADTTLGRTPNMRKLAATAMTEEEALPIVAKAMREVQSASVGLRASLTNRAKQVGELVEVNANSPTKLRDDILQVTIDADQGFNQLGMIAKSVPGPKGLVSLKLPEVLDDTLNKVVMQVNNRPTVDSLMKLQHATDKAILKSPTEDLKALNDQITLAIDSAAKNSALGKEWAKQYKVARADKLKGIEIAQLGMYKAFSKPELNKNEVADQLVKFADSGDAKVVLDALKGDAKVEAEAAISNALVRKYTNTFSNDGSKYVDFKGLTTALDNYSFTDPGVKAATDSIKQVADVFKIDPQLAAAARTTPTNAPGTPTQQLLKAANGLATTGLGGFGLGGFILGGHTGAAATAIGTAGAIAGIKTFKARSAANSLARVLSEPLNVKTYKEFLEENPGSASAFKDYQQAYAESRVANGIKMYVNKAGKYSATPAKGYKEQTVDKRSIASASDADIVMKEQGLRPDQVRAIHKALKDKGFKALLNGKLINL